MAITCSSCGGYNDRQPQRYCCLCHAAYMREHRPKHSELRRAARKAANARSYANVYQRRGLLEPKPCECAGPDCRGAVQKHHDDYSKPLQVRWMCVGHHQALHRDQDA